MNRRPRLPLAAALLMSWSRLLAQEEVTTPIALPPAAEFGTVCQGYTVEASFGLDWPADAANEQPTTDAPATVQVLECTNDKLTVRIDTSALGRLDATVAVRCGGHMIRIPIAATVLPPTDGAPRVLLASGLITNRSTDDMTQYQPFHREAAVGKLQVHHIVFPKAGRWIAPELLQKVDTVLISGSALVTLAAEDRLLLQGFACGGGRLIVCGSRFRAGTVGPANELMAPFGMQLQDIESRVDFEVASSELLQDQLTKGVDALKLSRVGTTRLDAPGTKALCRSHDLALFAVHRLEGGGEVITLPVPLWWHWIGSGKGNARLLRNLLTR